MKLRFKLKSAWRGEPYRYGKMELKWKLIMKETDLNEGKVKFN